MHPFLAQSEPDLSRFLLPAIGIIILSGLAFVVVAQVRKRLGRADAGEDVAPGGFTLSDLRRLHKAGKISDEEFERTRSGVISAAQKAAAREAAKAPAVVGKSIPGFDIAEIEQKRPPE